ncbi:MAG TPA: methyltransferase, TIGR04325 family [Cellvibrio sp.]|nr:methyltransferase, TIGR04325 family [Cellvibrio sp.]
MTQLPFFLFALLAIAGLLIAGLLSKYRNKLTLKRIIEALLVRIHDYLQPLNSMRGVYSSFAEAVAAAPATKPTGYDAANAQSWYYTKLNSIGLEDYPVLYWLRQAFADSSSLLEIGGHVGVAYYGFARVLEYPAELNWTIVDVPSVMQAGEAMARERQSRHLHFAHSGLAGMKGVDILMTVGALQYLETDLASIISDFQYKPRHLIINTTPVYEGPGFTTLQNLGSVYCAYRIFNRQEFVASLKAIGYTLIDSWAKPRQFRVPGHPDKAFDHYSGFYFRAGSP